MEVAEKVGPSILIAADGSVNRDFISKLPNPILLHILSLLPTKDAIQTSMLSKTWKTIWTSLEKFKLVLSASEFRGRRRERFQTKLNSWISNMCHIKEFELDLWDNFCAGELDAPSTILSAKTLRVMSLSGFNLVPLSNLDINFTSLRTMHLKDALLDDNIMQQLILGCPLLEDLSLNLCRDIKILYVAGIDKLKRLAVFNNFDMVKLEIDSPSLENLQISQDKTEVNIETCACLRKVFLFHGKFITDQWLSSLVSRCAFLEDLNIGYSEALRNLKITSNSLKVLKLNGSYKLLEVEINAPNLEKFIFRLNGSSLRCFDTWLLNASHTLEVQLILDHSYFRGLYYNQLTQFLANFNHFGTIDLSGPFDEIVIPKEERDNLASPLYAMKHLVLFGWDKVMKFSYVELLEYTLWLCPRVESLWMKTGTSRDNVETEIVLKLLYEDNVCVGSSFRCCKSLPVKCWWHCLVEARVEKLVGLEDCTKLKNFFLAHGKNLIC